MVTHGVGVVGMAVQFRLFGGIEAVVDGQPVDIGHSRQRCVLAVLLIEANRPVPADQLLDRVWGGARPPARPANAVQTYVSLLRRALAPAGEVRIGHSSAGYQLETDPRHIDLHEFHRLLTDSAEDALDRALGLWRGTPFGAADTPWLNAVRARLDDERHAAQLDLTDRRLRRGAHTVLLAGLTEQTAAHPLDERLAGQFLLALYRSGRPADALDHYQRLRDRLRDELGTDPGLDLRRLHERILRADPTLTEPEPETEPRPEAEPEAATMTAARPSIPRQLPAAPRLFTGRDAELAALDKIMANTGTLVISAIGGTGGIGKTWLALQWAHRNAERFPDGQLHANLRGFDPGGQPTPPATVVRGFLDALGVEPAAIPLDLDAQLGLYRSLLADRRMLIVLDNAADTAQVTPLLPGTPAATVLVTSRRRLTGLVATHGARTLNLDVLADAEARDLLARHLGPQRLAGEPAEAAELLGYCAGLPLAISLVAARAASHPDFPLAELAAELRDHTARLDALETDDRHTNLRAVLSWSQHALSPDAAHTFALLGLAPGPDLGLDAAAALIAGTPSRARQILRELEDAHLVHQPAPGRYRMHDLVRLYAADHARHTIPAPDRAAALHRFVDTLLHTGYSAARLLNPNRAAITLDPPVPGCAPRALTDEAAALPWFAAEHANLVAAQPVAMAHEWFTEAWQLAWVVDTYHWRRGLLRDAHALWEAALLAADRLDDPAVRCQVHHRLGNICAPLGRLDEALRHVTAALALAEQTGDRTDEAYAHHTLAWIHEDRADDRNALHHATRALHLFRQLDTPAWEANALNSVAWYHARLGEYERARASCAEAQELFGRHPDPQGKAANLDTLGYIAHHSDQPAQARDYYQQALELFRELGFSYEEANTLEHLGETQHALGEASLARAAWRRAHTLYRAQRRSADAERVRALLDQVAMSG